MRAKFFKHRRKFMLFWAQDGMCYLCHKQMPHPADATNPLRAVTVDTIRDGGFPKRRNFLACHQMCDNIKKNRLPTPWELDYLRMINIKLLRFETEEWPDSVNFLREQSCFLRFTLRAELRGTENPDVDLLERHPAGSEIPSEP